MKAKNILSFIQNKYIFHDIISYFPENISKNRILNIFRYNKKCQKLLNIDLYNYQKEYLNLALKKVNPREYNISHLHNYFKLKNTFNKEKDKEIFIKIIKELFPEEKEEESNITNELNFTKITNLDNIKNVISLELCELPNEFDLKLINVPNIKKLKLKEGKEGNIAKINMPFSLLNKLEVLILGAMKINIYCIPDNNDNNDNVELKNLKYLQLKKTRVTKKINIIFDSPNLIYLNLEFYYAYKKKSYLAYYFNLCEEEDNDSYSFSNSFNSYDSHQYDPFKYDLPQNEIADYYNKYINLKILSLSIFDSDDRIKYEKNIECEKITDNIIKCFYRIEVAHTEYDDENYEIIESFLYEKKNHERFKIQADIKINNNYNCFNCFYCDYDENNLEKIEFEGCFFDKEYNPLVPLIFYNIEYDNYSLQVIKLKDYCCLEKNSKEGFIQFIQNIRKFLFLRVIELEINENEDEDEVIFDYEELDILIKNLFTLKLLEKIHIKIWEPKIKKISKEF